MVERNINSAAYGCLMRTSEADAPLAMFHFLRNPSLVAFQMRLASAMTYETASERNTK